MITAVIASFDSNFDSPPSDETKRIGVKIAPERSTLIYFALQVRKKEKMKMLMFQLQQVSSEKRGKYEHSYVTFRNQFRFNLFQTFQQS